VASDQYRALEETGFRTIFDGQSMKGWIADPDFWRVEDGVMVGETKAGPSTATEYLCIWRAASPAILNSGCNIA